MFTHGRLGKRMNRLDWTTLGERIGDAIAPRYEPQAVSIGIVHLGVGNFHRSHQAPCFDDALNAGDLRWGVSGVSLKRPLLRDALAPQHGLYTLDRGEGPLRVIGCLRETLVGGEDADAITSRMADPAVHWWTLTITEKGYCTAPAAAEGRPTLDLGSPDIRADLEMKGTPRTGPGQLFAGVVRRFGGHAASQTASDATEASLARAARQLTVASCDNLQGNGRTLRGLLIDFAEAARREQRWRSAAGRLSGRCGPIDAIDILPGLIANDIVFPDSMVDRIAPATNDAARARIAERLGLVDAWPVITEPFTQWVIEDCVKGPRPALDASGVEWSTDVGIHEVMKLRLLNGAHSVMAYAGRLAGHQTVDRAFADPVIRGFVDAYWRQAIIPELPPAAQARAPAYCNELRTRFANPTIGHRLAQIAMDGSMKIPLRWFGADRRIGSRTEEISRALACWIRWLSIAPDDELVDPQAARLRVAARSPDAQAAVSEILAAIGATGSPTQITRVVTDTAMHLRHPAHPLAGAPTR